MVPHDVARRTVLQGLGALFAWSHVPRLAHAAGRDPRFLTVILRGGMDGLALLPPVGDPAYQALRHSFGLTNPGASLPLTDLFALNAALPELGKLYGAGQALFVHAVATPYRGRSHFDGQDQLENGMAGKASLESGWLNRALTKMPRGEKLPPGKGLAIAPAVPVVMRGTAPVMTWQPQRYRYADQNTITRLLDLYEERDPALAQALREGAAADRMMQQQGGGKIEKAVGRPDFITEAAAAARLMSQPDGPRIGAMSFYGWDTHAGEGAATGHLARHLHALDDAIHALHEGLKPVWQDTVIAIVTEFGRTVRVNGTAGTDHGTATAAILVGGGIRGGRVISDWPGLADKALYEGRDLAPTQDLRGVLKGVLAEHLGIDPKVLNATVFPDSEAAPLLRGLCA